MTTEPKKEKVQMLTGLRALYKLIHTALHIPYLKDEKPVGILIVSKPGMGKSMILTRFKCDSIVMLNDVTGYGLERTVMELEGKGSGYIINPDLLRLMSRKKGWEAFLTLTNIILEEGVSGIRRADVNMQFKHPINFGLITAMTTDCFRRHYDEFVKVGFASRFGIFSYNYEPSDKAKIEKMVSMKSVNPAFQYKVEPDLKLKQSGEITVSPEMGKYIQRLGKILANGKHEAFRGIVFIRRMVKAHAFADKRNEVNIKDIQEMFALVPFFVPPYPTATDLEYLILKGFADEELEKVYTSNEIYDAHERLFKKRISWDMVIGPERVENRSRNEGYSSDMPFRNEGEIFS